MNNNGIQQFFLAVRQNTKSFFIMKQWTCQQKAVQNCW